MIPKGQTIQYQHFIIKVSNQTFFKFKMYNSQKVEEGFLHQTGAKTGENKRRKATLRSYLHKEQSPVAHL